MLCCAHDFVQSVHNNALLTSWAAVTHSDLLPPSHFRCTGEVIKLLHHTLTSQVCRRESYKQDSSKAHLMRWQHGLTLRHMQGEPLQGDHLQGV